jgi:hypothetical protein
MTKKVLVVGVAVALVLGVGGAAFAYWTTTGSGTGSAQTGKASNVLINQIGTAAYNSTVSPLPGSMTSQAFSGPQISEFGNEINLASSGPLSSVVVTMDSWACQTGSWGVAYGTAGACVTTPGATYPVPITLSIYNSAGTTLTTAVQTFNIPFRPSASATCTSGEWLATDGCHNGLATNITFTDFGPAAVVLPSTVIYGISYTTDNNGADGNVDSLNVALSTEATNVTVGSDTNLGDIFVQSLQADAGGSALESNLGGCSGAPAGVLSTFQVVPVQCPTGYGLTSNIPAVQFNLGVGDLYPGGPALPISFSLTNPGSSAVLVSTVTIGIAQDPTTSVAPEIESTPGNTSTDVLGCYADWFQINGSPVTVNQTIPAGGTIDWVGAASIQLNNDPINQDLCQNVAVGLTFTSP